MVSELLKKTREYEIEKEKKISKEDRPNIHLTSRVGWMNDPNGFCYYNDCYHMFYQYHPYKSFWGPMHWGHAVSKDLIKWNYMPVVLAPDTKYDNFGCFSGNAITLKDGRHLLMYTSVMTSKLENGEKKEFQQQSIAIGDGKEYVKHEMNPVIKTNQIPKGYSIVDFRDPKIWLGKDGIYRVLIAACDEKGLGHILLYVSKDCIEWKYKKVFIKNNGHYGKMWECPDFFMADGKAAVVVSPMDMLPKDLEYHNGNGTLCLIGSYDEKSDEFVVEKDQAVDYGIDFYAPQSTRTPDGRHVMIGWMQNWATSNEHDENVKYFGQMSIPREVKIIDNKLYQNPIKELEQYRRNKVEYENVCFCNETITLDNICGRCVDVEVEVESAKKDDLFDKFFVSMAMNEEYHTDFIYDAKDCVAKIDRKFAGSRKAILHQRSTNIELIDSKLKIRFILDKNSVEVFLQDGQKVMTATIYTDSDADKISFGAVGCVNMSVTKYDLI